MCEFSEEMPKFPLDAQQQSPKDDIYNSALAKIEQLECDLQQKEKALTINLKEQMTLRDSLKACIKTIRRVTSQFNMVTSDLKNINHQYSQAHDHVEALVLENKRLMLSNAAWSSRSIKLEFDLLRADEEIKVIKADHDLAVAMIALLVTELKAIKTENKILQHNCDNGDGRCL